jgi:hypothetical protein
MEADADEDFTPLSEEKKKKSTWSSKAKLYILYTFLAMVAIVVVAEGVRAVAQGESFNMEIFQKVLDGIIAILGA